MSSPSASRVSSSLNRLPSSPRSNSNVQPGYLKSGSPPGASITPSSETNSVTTISADTLDLLGLRASVVDKTEVGSRTHRVRLATRSSAHAQDSQPVDDEGAMTTTVIDPQVTEQAARRLGCTCESPEPRAEGS